MNENLFNMILIVTIGTLISTGIFIFLDKAIKKIIWFFQLYPESQSILNFALKFISGFISAIVFLLFLRIGLRQAGFEFTSKFIEETILIIPKYIFAILIILFGKYSIKILDNLSEKYEFKYRQEFLAITNTILILAFILTALSMIGVNVNLFSDIFKTIILSFGIMISIIIGIPVGLSIYESRKRSIKNKKR